MIVIIYGPAGSGKGTQAKLISEALGFRHFSMGEALREEIKKKSAIGKKVESIVNSGKLVPAEITNNIVLDACTKEKKGIVLDGYPRNSAQMKFVKKNLKIDYAFELDVSDREVVRRLSARWSCPKCGKGYNTIYIKPKISGKCDIDAASLVQRDDDKPAQIKKRLEIYHKDTFPMRTYYKKLGVLHLIDGSKSIDAVHKSIMKIFKNG
ncbi:MAG: adenylate kinase family protein [Candidatus Woesearchaeota archaeon]